MNSCLFSSATVEWATPQALFDELDAEFHFNLDPCCTHENAKCTEHFTKAEDGLSQNWGGGVKGCFAIRPTGENSPNGSRKRMTRLRKARWW